MNTNEREKTNGNRLHPPKMQEEVPKTGSSLIPLPSLNTQMATVEQQLLAKQEEKEREFEMQMRLMEMKHQQVMAALPATNFISSLSELIVDSSAQNLKEAKNLKDGQKGTEETTWKFSIEEN